MGKSNLKVSHNILPDLQGGTDDEYYHLTSAEHTSFGSLIDNSIVNTLHRHSELVASDGSPDPALSVDADGKIGFGTAPSYDFHFVKSDSSGITKRLCSLNLGFSGTVSGADASQYGEWIAVVSTVVGTQAVGTRHRLHGLAVTTAVSTPGNTYENAGIWVEAKHNHTTNTNTLTGIKLTAKHNSTGIVAVAKGFDGITYNASSGTISDARGLSGEIWASGGDGTITNAYGVNSAIWRGSGTIETGYLFHGYYVGTVGTKWGIYLSGETKNYMSGNLGLGGDPGANKLYVGGLIKLLSGTSINEFSIDGTLAGNSDDAVPTEQAVKAYVDGVIHAEAHDIASHSDTTTTGAELETLTDNSIADALHRHTELVASDGDPDPAVSVNASGHVTIGGNLTAYDNLFSEGSMQVGVYGSGNRYSFFSLYGDDSNYGVRFMRSNTGVNAYSQIGHKGTGDFRITAENAAALKFETTNTTRLTIAAGGNVGIGTTSPLELLDVNSDAIRIRTSQTPASAGAAGTQGMVCWDTDYVYICIATDTWKRAALSTWP